MLTKRFIDAGNKSSLPYAGGREGEPNIPRPAPEPFEARECLNCRMVFPSRNGEVYCVLCRPHHQEGT